MADQIPDSAKSDSIYDIARNSPPFSWEERAAVDKMDVEAALGASVPGGSRVLAWLPMVDGHTIHRTARDVMRAAIAAVDKARATRPTPPAMDREAVMRLREAASAMLPKNICLTNPRWPDETVVPLETTLGELRALSAALSTLSADAIRQEEGATTAKSSVVGTDLWRHVKRGTVYEVIGTAELQAGQPQLEHAELVIYRGEDGKLWARNSGEFHDGRFVPATPASHASDGGEGE